MSPNKEAVLKRLNEIENSLKAQKSKSNITIKEIKNRANTLFKTSEFDNVTTNQGIILKMNELFGYHIMSDEKNTTEVAPLPETVSLLEIEDKQYVAPEPVNAVVIKAPPPETSIRYLKLTPTILDMLRVKAYFNEEWISGDQTRLEFYQDIFLKMQTIIRGTEKQAADAYFSDVLQFFTIEYKQVIDVLTECFNLENSRLKRSAMLEAHAKFRAKKHTPEFLYQLNRHLPERKKIVIQDMREASVEIDLINDEPLLLHSILVALLEHQQHTVAFFEKAAEIAQTKYSATNELNQLYDGLTPEQIERKIRISKIGDIHKKLYEKYNKEIIVLFNQVGALSSLFHTEMMVKNVMTGNKDSSRFDDIDSGLFGWLTKPVYGVPIFTFLTGFGNAMVSMLQLGMLLDGISVAIEPGTLQSYAWFATAGVHILIILMRDMPQIFRKPEESGPQIKGKIAQFLEKLQIGALFYATAMDWLFPIVFQACVYFSGTSFTENVIIPNATLGWSFAQLSTWVLSHFNEYVTSVTLLYAFRSIQNNKTIEFASGAIITMVIDPIIIKATVELDMIPAFYFETFFISNELVPLARENVKFKFLDDKNFAWLQGLNNKEKQKEFKKLNIIEHDKLLHKNQSISDITHKKIGLRLASFTQRFLNQKGWKSYFSKKERVRERVLKEKEHIDEIELDSCGIEIQSSNSRDYDTYFLRKKARPNNAIARFTNTTLTNKNNEIEETDETDVSKNLLENSEDKLVLINYETLNIEQLIKELTTMKKVLAKTIEYNKILEKQIVLNNEKKETKLHLIPVSSSKINQSQSLFTLFKFLSSSLVLVPTFISLYNFFIQLSQGIINVQNALPQLFNILGSLAEKNGNTAETINQLKDAANLFGAAISVTKQYKDIAQLTMKRQIQIIADRSEKDGTLKAQVDEAEQILRERKLNSNY